VYEVYGEVDGASTSAVDHKVVNSSRIYGVESFGVQRDSAVHRPDHIPFDPLLREIT